MPHSNNLSIEELDTTAAMIEAASLRVAEANQRLNTVINEISSTCNDSYLAHMEDLIKAWRSYLEKISRFSKLQYEGGTNARLSELTIYADETERFVSYLGSMIQK